MTKVLLFGATGNVGKKIAAELTAQGYDLTIVARSKEKAGELAAITANFKIADVTRPKQLHDICRGFEVIVSALGKSVSINDKSKPSFHDINFTANANILMDAKKNVVRKFVYVSALHSEKYTHLGYFNAHHSFSQKLKQSGINYSIIKPAAVYSAFADLIPMAREGKLVTIGKGDKKTNPIYEGDLAKICVDSIKEYNAIVEAGGKHIYTRQQINDIIQQAVNPALKIKNVPVGSIKFMLPFIKIFNSNKYDKYAFFTEVTQHHTIAPMLGEMKLEDYIKARVR